jgi:hypothetical protein
MSITESGQAESISHEWKFEGRRCFVNNYRRVKTRLTSVECSENIG